jgi:hypothetical protein
VIDRASVDVMAKEIHRILCDGSALEEKRARIPDVLKAHGCAGDWPSVQALILSKPEPRTLEEVFSTLGYIFCLPLSYEERRHVVGANGLFFGVDVEGRRKVGGTVRQRARKRAKHS